MSVIEPVIEQALQYSRELGQSMVSSYAGLDRKIAHREAVIEELAQRRDACQCDELDQENIKLRARIEELESEVRDMKWSAS